jgi:hypothetical protein
VAAVAGALDAQGRNNRQKREMMFFSADLLDEFASLWFQAPMVISSRLQDFALSGGSPSGAAEVSRMITEKFSAATESVMAVGMAMTNEGMIAATALATGTCAGLAGASDRVAVAALKPYGKRVRANALRLSE